MQPRTATGQGAVHIRKDAHPFSVAAETDDTEHISRIIAEATANTGTERFTHCSPLFPIKTVTVV